MRFMVIVKANKESESGALPDEKALAAMGKFNEELVKAGVMLAGEGLQPSAKGVRITLRRAGKRTVVDGPFAETKELVAGYWLLQTKTRRSAIEWIKRAPFDAGRHESRFASCSRPRTSPPAIRPASCARRRQRLRETVGPRPLARPRSRTAIHPAAPAGEGESVSLRPRAGIFCAGASPAAVGADDVDTDDQLGVVLLVERLPHREALAARVISPENVNTSPRQPGDVPMKRPPP